MQLIRVVIVDDSPAVRDGFQSILGPHEDILVVGTACDGSEAVCLVQDVQPDVVLMDAQMPVMDGVQATRLIKEHDPGVKVLFLTVHTPYLQHGLDAGADLALLKDVDRRELISTVRQLACS